MILGVVNSWQLCKGAKSDEEKNLLNALDSRFIKQK